MEECIAIVYYHSFPSVVILILILCKGYGYCDYHRYAVRKWGLLCITLTQIGSLAYWIYHDTLITPFNKSLKKQYRLHVLSEKERKNERR